MGTTVWPGNMVWPLWQKIIFRFLFIYFLLFVVTNPWFWSDNIPGSGKLLPYFYQFMEWLVNLANNKIFHLYKSIPFYSVGDTSSGWIQMYMLLLLSLAGCIIWSWLDLKRANCNRLAYFFRILLRYALIFNCFSYGFNKVVLFQMPFPSISQLATPLGDYLPMRLSWLTMGTSSTYQFFAGSIELFAGILLLFRRTSTFGTIVALGVFTNVMMMNLGYDVQVKSFSIHLVIICLVLLAFEFKRIAALLLNKPLTAGNLYTVGFSNKWMRISRVIVK